MLPKKILRIVVPPVKCQGIKTKLLPFIAENLQWSANGWWIEPFLGSGVVAFNIRPERAILADTNEHIIKLYTQIQTKIITPSLVKQTLHDMGECLSKNGEDYYYEIRKRFNKEKNSLDFLFLNRSCFNGLMRFNSKGEFNVPFGKKLHRFSRAYITKITNQIRNVQLIILERDWTFVCQDWKVTLEEAKENDFVYLDPPYIGRHTDYFNSWTMDEAIELSKKTQQLPCKYALSMWLENKYRTNTYINEFWNTHNMFTKSHFYHVGSTENLRNSVVEALVLK